MTGQRPQTLEDAFRLDAALREATDADSIPVIDEYVEDVEGNPVLLNPHSTLRRILELE